MQEFYLEFMSVTNSVYGEQVPFRIKIECDSIRKANLIGKRMDMQSWEFKRAVEVEESNANSSDK